MADAAGNDGQQPAADSGREAEADSGIPPGVPLTGLAAAELDRCGITSVGDAQVMSFELPKELTAVPYTHLDRGCFDGGFDLSRCAGHTVELTTVVTDDAIPRVWAHVMTLDDCVCCTYKSITNTGGAVGSAPCGPAYPARAAMQRCNMIERYVNPQRRVEAVDVPASLSDDPLWSERAKVCRDGEYDLAKCAGKKALLLTFDQNSYVEAGRDPMRASILTHGEDVCCIWQTDGAKPPALLPRKCE